MLMRSRTAYELSQKVSDNRPMNWRYFHRRTPMIGAMWVFFLSFITGCTAGQTTETVGEEGAPLAARYDRNNMGGGNSKIQGLPPAGRTAYGYLARIIDQFHTSSDVYTDSHAAGNHFAARGRMSSPGDKDVSG